MTPLSMKEISWAQRPTFKGEIDYKTHEQFAERLARLEQRHGSSVASEQAATPSSEQAATPSSDSSSKTATASAASAVESSVPDPRPHARGAKVMWQPPSAAAAGVAPVPLRHSTPADKHGCKKKGQEPAWLNDFRAATQAHISACQAQAAAATAAAAAMREVSQGLVNTLKDLLGGCGPQFDATDSRHRQPPVVGPPPYYPVAPYINPSPYPVGRSPDHVGQFYPQLGNSRWQQHPQQLEGGLHHEYDCGRGGSSAGLS